MDPSQTQNAPSAAGNGNNTNGNDYEQRFRRLKKKYGLLLQEHLKVRNELNKTTHDVQTLKCETAFMKSKVKEVLARNGIEADDFDEEEQDLDEAVGAKKDGSTSPQPNHQLEKVNSLNESIDQE